MNIIIIIQLVVAFVIGLTSLFILYRITNNFLTKTYQIEEQDNTAFTVLQMGIILSGSLVLSSIITPAINVIRIMNPSGALNMSNVLTSIGYVALFAIIGIVCTVVILAMGIFMIFQMTKVNEMEEIKQNKINASLITVALIIGLSLIIDDYCGQLCEALIPYPEVPNFL